MKPGLVGRKYVRSELKKRDYNIRTITGAVRNYAFIEEKDARGYKMQSKLVSISIAAYNIENFIEETVKSHIINDENLAMIEIII